MVASRHATVMTAIGLSLCTALVPACCGENRDAPPVRWLASLETARGTEAEAHGVVVDAQGNVYTTGHFRGTIGLCGKPIQSAPAATPEKDDMFLVKLSSDGKCRWLKSFRRAAGTAIALDADQNIVVTGKLHEQVDFGGGKIGPEAWSTWMFLASFDPNGAHRWSRAYGKRHVSIGERIAIGRNGQIVVAGSYVTTLEVGAPRIDRGGHPSSGFIAQFDATGTPQWSLALGDGLSVDPFVAVEASGHVLIAGAFGAELNLGGATLNATRPIPTGPKPVVELDGGRLRRDIFIAKLDAKGEHVWSHSYGDEEDQSANGIDVDDTGRVYLLASVAGTVNLGDGPRTGSPGGTLVAALHPDGRCAWSKRFGNRVLVFFGGDTAPRALRATSNGVIIAGRVSGSVDFGGGALGGGRDRGYVVALDRDGEHRWSMALESNMDAFAFDASVGPTGDVALAGFFHADAELGGKRATSVNAWKDSDAFVASFSDR
jgi:hypothetical protein